MLVRVWQELEGGKGERGEVGQPHLILVHEEQRKALFRERRMGQTWRECRGGLTWLHEAGVIE